MRNYPTLTRGDIIEISYNCLTFEILIMEVQPDADGISIIETDLEVDFAAPKGYVEPAPQPRAAPSTMASKLHIDQAKYDVVRGAASSDGASASTPFRGLGQTLSGKKTKGKKDKPITPRDHRASCAVPSTCLHSHSRPAIVTNDTLREDKHVPAALNLPFGQLFFGYDVERLPVPVSHADSAPAPSQDAPPPGGTAFQGQGHTLWARPPPEVIDIDSD